MKIARLTTTCASCGAGAAAIKDRALHKLRRDGVKAGVTLPRQTQYMRRFFGTQVAALTPDVNTVHTLMRHTNLGTTSNYMMAVNEVHASRRA